MVGPGSVFFKIKFFHRVGLGTVGRASQKARHAHAQVFGVIRLTQATPAGILGCREDFGQIARIGQFLPRFHLHEGWTGPGDERRMRGGRNFGHFAQQLYIRRALVKMVVADNGAEGFAAKLAVLLLINFLEQRALVPGSALEALERLTQIQLGDVHHADFQVLIRFSVVHHVVQAAPGTFELLKVRVVQDQVELGAQFFINRGNHGVDGFGDVFANQLGLAQRLLCQGLHSRFDGTFRLVAAGFKFFLQQRCKVSAFKGNTG